MTGKEILEAIFAELPSKKEDKMYLSQRKPMLPKEITPSNETVNLHSPATESSSSIIHVTKHDKRTTDSTDYSSKLVEGVIININQKVFELSLRISGKNKVISKINLSSQQQPSFVFEINYTDLI